MPHLVVAHQVEDYAKWRQAYDDHENVRVSAGLGGARVYQDVNDPNQVTVVAEGELSQLQAFAASEDLKDAMKAAGVVGQPQLMFVADVT